MTRYQVLYWHDIPLQVRAGGRRDRVSRPLSLRFQEAADQAAVAAGMTGTEDYLAQLRWSDEQEREGAPGEVAETVAAELEAQFARIEWRKTAAALAASE